ncbi:MAG: hypothetical protein GFH23_1086616n40 [Chloroflexi bacterium AL-N1]|nr:hypothetical protein [Chloroflexi bacterium AL-N1]
MALVSIVSGLSTPEEVSLLVVSGREFVVFFMIPIFLGLLIPWILIQWLYLYSTGIAVRKHICVGKCSA